MPEVAEAPEEVVDIPATEKVAINRMADKFKAAMKGLPTEPAAIAPVETPPAKPAEPKPAEKPATPPAPAPTPTPAPAKTEPEIPDLPKTTKDWNALKEVRDKYKKDYETLKPQFDSLATEKAALVAERDAAKVALEEAKKGTAEYEQLKTEHEQAKKLVDEFYVERSPQFQSHFGQRLQAAKMEATEAVGQEHAEKIKSVLENPPSKYRDEQIKAIVAELDEFERGRVINAYQELYRIERERAAELAKAPENRKKLAAIEEQQAQERTAHNVKMRTGFLEDINKQLEPELNGFPEAEAIKTAVKKVIFNEASAPEYTALIADAARWRRHKSSIAEKDEHIAKLESQLAEIQASNPTVQSSSASPAKSAPSPMDNSDIGDKFKKAMGRK